MKVSNEIDYGLRAMTVIASFPDRMLSSKEISKKFGIPYNFLTLILARLVKAGLITSVQGPKGGYKLNCDMAKVSFYDIICALDTKLEITTCASETGCNFEEICGISPVWKNLNNNMESFLKEVTLADIAMDKEAFQKIKEICEKESLDGIC